MELIEIFKLIQKRIWIFLTIVICFVVGAYFFSITKPDMFTGSITFYTLITPQSQDTVDNGFYEYDNYYNFKASESLVDTIISWFKDPAYVSKVYSKANENLPDVSWKKYSKLINTKKIVPASLIVSISNPDEDYVKNILNASKTFVQENITEWTKQGLIKNIYAQSSDVFIVREKPDITLNITIGAIVGLVMGFVLIYILDKAKHK